MGKRLLYGAVVFIVVAVFVLTQNIPSPPEDEEIETMYVYKGEREVLIVRNTAGYITSTAILPPGVEPVKHPFLSAQALSPEEEDNLRQILEKAHSFEEFIFLLQENGYKVE